MRKFLIVLAAMLAACGAAHAQRPNSDFIGFGPEAVFKEPAGWAAEGEPSGYVEFYMARGSFFRNTTIRRGTPPGSRAQVYAKTYGEYETVNGYEDGVTDHVRFKVPAGPQYFVLEYPGGLFYPMTVNVALGKITPVSIWWVKDTGIFSVKYALDAHPFPPVDPVMGPVQQQRHPRSR
jgi:hypothetical protein